MSTIAANYTHAHTGIASTKIAAARVISLLRLTFGLVPVVAGADKFTDLLVNWDQYLAPTVAHLLPFSTHSFMMIVGVIEIIAGLTVLARPRIGSLVVCLWLIAIAVNLLISGQYYDVAVRDLVMSTGAYSLFILTRKKA
jgi:hypothetical protein